jgi:hypothetical protein
MYGVVNPENLSNVPCVLFTNPIITQIKCSVSLCFDTSSDSLRYLICALYLTLVKMTLSRREERWRELNYIRT